MRREGQAGPGRCNPFSLHTQLLFVPKADHDYTVVAIGLLKGMGAEKLSALVLDDDPMAKSM